MLQLDTAPAVNAGRAPAIRRPIASVERAPRRLAAPALPLAARLDRIDAAIHGWLVAYSVVALRVSLGAVFLVFGALKLFPGVSPAASLVEATTHILFLGLVPGPVALVGVGLLECVIGLLLLSGKAPRSAIYLLASQLLGILSPVVLLAPRLFSGPNNAPTLEGQYVLKDVILVGAALVLAATLRGGHLTSGANPPEEQTIDAGQRVGTVGHA